MLDYTTKKGKSLMKKLLSFLMAAVLMLSLSVTSMAESRLYNIGGDQSVSDRYEHYFAKLTYLKNTLKIKKKTLEVKRDEFLMIPKGVKLYLYDGAEISGNIYVAKGGYLYVRGGDVTVLNGGSIYADGYVSFSEKSTVALEGNSELFVNKMGTLKFASDDCISINSKSLGDIICIGKTNSSSDFINKKAVAAYISDENGTVPAQEPEKLLPTSRNYRASAGMIDSGTKQRVVFIFDKGACLRADKRSGKFRFIGNTCIAIAGSYLYNDGFYNDINRIVTINGTDYTASLSQGGGYLVRLTDDLTPVDFDIDSDEHPVAAEGIYNLAKCKYLGKSQTPLPVYFGSAGADLYLMDNGYIIAVRPCESPESYFLPKDMPPEDVLKQYYDIALYEPV